MSVSSHKEKPLSLRRESVWKSCAGTIAILLSSLEVEALPSWARALGLALETQGFFDPAAPVKKLIWTNSKYYIVVQLSVYE